VSPGELRLLARAMARRTAHEQGLPEHVVDPQALANLAVILSPAEHPGERARVA